MSKPHTHDAEGDGCAVATTRKPRGASRRSGRPPARSGARDDDTTARRQDMAPVSVDRLLRIYDLCVELEEEGRRRVQSQEIAERIGQSASQIRRDLSRFGKLGKRGSGYEVGGLIAVLKRFFGRHVPRKMVLVGAGGLCSVLLGHGIPELQGLRFSAVFDTNAGMVGARCGGLVVRDVSEMPEVLASMRAEIAVLAVPASQAQHVAELLVENGVRAILNLTPVALTPRRGVTVRNVDLSLELENLVFDATCRTPASAPECTGVRRHPVGAWRLARGESRWRKCRSRYRDSETPSAGRG